MLLSKHAAVPLSSRMKSDWLHPEVATCLWSFYVSHIHYSPKTVTAEGIVGLNVQQTQYSKASSNICVVTAYICGISNILIIVAVSHRTRAAAVLSSRLCL